LHITILNIYLWATDKHNAVFVNNKFSTQTINKMKTSFFLALVCLVALSIFVAWSRFETNNHNTSISISETDDTYKLKASFDVNHTVKVWRYVNNFIAPNSLGKSENDYFDVTTSLQDKTEFYIKESPGKLKIELNKRKNTTASYLRIKKMCEGIKGLLADK